MKDTGIECKLYAYCDPRFTNEGEGYWYEIIKRKILRFKNEPFYIGCASWNRHRRHLWGKTNKFVKNRIEEIRAENLEPIILILKTFPKENRKKALMIEEKLITRIGRKDLKKGPLLNLVDGPGFKNFNKEIKEEIRTKVWDNPEKSNRIKSAVRKSMTERWKNPAYREKMRKVSSEVGKKFVGENNPMYGRTGSDHPMFGRHHSEETKNKIRMKNKGRVSWMKGKKHKKESIEKSRKSHIGIQAGEKHPLTKFTNKDIEKIRRLGYVDCCTIKEIANKFAVSKSCIQHIIQGHHWNPNKLTKKELVKQFVDE